MSENDKLMKIEPVVTEVMSHQPAFTTITKAEEATITAEFMAEVVGVRRRISDFFRPDIDAANALHKSLLAKMREIDAKPAAAEQTFRRMLSDWHDREARRVREEQRRLDEEAKARAAAEARENGDKRTAKAIETGKLAVVSEVVAEAPEKIEGVSFRKNYRAEVTDIAELIRAAAAGKVPAEYLTANLVALNGVMRATKGRAQIPGVRAIEETGTTRRFS